MGYMGFGMRREVYTRKPKKIFENIEKEPLNKASKRFKNNQYFSSEEVEIAKNNIRKKLKKKKLISVSITFIIAFTLVIILFMIMY